MDESTSAKLREIERTADELGSRSFVVYHVGDFQADNFRAVTFRDFFDKAKRVTDYMDGQGLLEEWHGYERTARHARLCLTHGVYEATVVRQNYAGLWVAEK